MSEIMRCVFEKREPVRNVTALALMQYACEEFPRSRVDVVVGMDDFMDKPSMGDDDILWSVEERVAQACGRVEIRRVPLAFGAQCFVWTTPLHCAAGGYNLSFPLRRGLRRAKAPEARLLLGYIVGEHHVFTG